MTKRSQVYLTAFSKIGQSAGWMFHHRLYVYADVNYDLVLDTSKLTAHEFAQKIKAFIETH